VSRDAVTAGMVFRAAGSLFGGHRPVEEFARMSETIWQPRSGKPS
jgi:hypothetical protein